MSKQLLVYGGIPLVLILVGYTFISNFQITKKGNGNQTGGKVIVAENSPKRIEYQGVKYLLDGDYCRKSTESRIAIIIKRSEGADPGEGSDGNTMYAIGDKDNPGYIDSEKDPKVASKTRNCWMKESFTNLKRLTYQSLVTFLAARRGVGLSPTSFSSHDGMIIEQSTGLLNLNILNLQ